MWTRPNDYVIIDDNITSGESPDGITTETAAVSGLYHQQESNQNAVGTFAIPVVHANGAME